MAQRYELKDMLLTPGRGGRPGKKITPKALVIHWTANTAKGANAVANRNYFENHPQNKVSAHYVVDDSQVVQCVPDNEQAYHVGARKYTKAALAQLSEYPNDCTIGIEICVNYDGEFKKTYQNAVALTADVLHRHGWGADRLWRHYDVTGKDCPQFFVDDKTARTYGFTGAAGGWEKFKKDVAAELKAMEVVALFKDVVGRWSQESVERLAKQGIVKGKTADTFDPSGTVTREEMSVVVDRAIQYVLQKVKEMIGNAA